MDDRFEASSDTTYDESGDTTTGSESLDQKNLSKIQKNELEKIEETWRLLQEVMEKNPRLVPGDVNRSFAQRMAELPHADEIASRLMEGDREFAHNMKYTKAQYLELVLKVRVGHLRREMEEYLPAKKGGKAVDEVELAIQ